MAFRYPRETDNYGNDPPQREAENQSCYCRPCGMNFKTWEALHDHKSRHPRHKKTYCVHCSKEFATEDATVTHRRLFHGHEQNLPCPHCGTIFPRLAGLVNHIEAKLCPAAPAFKFEERVEQKRKHYENWDNVMDRVNYGNTAGDFSLPPLDFSSEPPKAPQLKPTESPQSPPSTYNTQAASDTDVQSTYCPTENATDDTKLTAQSDAPGESEDLMWFIEPENHATKNGNAHIRQVDPTYLRTANDDVDFPALGSLSLHSKAPTDNKLKSKAWVKPNSKSAAPPAVHNAWTNNLSSAANVKGARSAIPSPWGQKQSSSSTPSSANPNVPAARSNFPLVNKIALAPASIKEKFQYHPFDPDQPKFDISPFFNDYIKKYKCPYRTCTKSVEKPAAFLNHLKSSAHVKKYQCKRCLNHFATLAALVAHSESQSSRCTVRESDFYGGVVDELTGGIAAPVGLHPDNTTRYIVNDIDAIMGQIQQAQDKNETQRSWDRA